MGYNNTSFLLRTARISGHAPNKMDLNLFFLGMAVALLGAWACHLWALESKARGQNAARALLTSYRLAPAPYLGNAEAGTAPGLDGPVPPQSLDWVNGYLLHLNVEVSSLRESEEVHQALRELGLHPYVSVRSLFAPAAPDLAGPVRPSVPRPQLRLVLNAPLKNLEA